MSCKKTFAVLLAAYNGREWIEQQIISILNQKNVDITLYISVDLSTDGTFEYCEGLAVVNNNVHVLSYGRRFGSAARNYFRLIKDVDLSKYEFVAFADQDDIWIEDKLDAAQKLLINSNYSAYSSNVTAFWVNGKTKLICKSQQQRSWDYLFEAAGPGCTYVLCNELALSLQQNVIDNWDAIQDVYLHDWYSYAYARANGYEWFIDKTPYIYYRQHQSNHVGTNIGIKAIKSRLDKIINGYGLEQARLIGLLIGINDEPFFRNWSQLRRIDKFKLAFKARSCRRRTLDQCYFFLVCILLMFQHQ